MALPNYDIEQLRKESIELCIQALNELGIDIIIIE
jgi:hypothetical protein